MRPTQRGGEEVRTSAVRKGYHVLGPTNETKTCKHMSEKLCVAREITIVYLRVVGLGEIALASGPMPPSKVGPLANDAKYEVAATRTGSSAARCSCRVGSGFGFVWLGSAPVLCSCSLLLAGQGPHRLQVLRFQSMRSL